MHQRTERVASLLIKEVSQAVREDIQDSNIGFVTFLRADASKDLRNARVYYSVLGTDDEKLRTDLAIQKHAKEIKRIVNDRIQLRYAVDIRFVREEGIDHAFRIEEILNQIKKERASESPEPETPSPAGGESAALPESSESPEPPQK